LKIVAAALVGAGMTLFGAMAVGARGLQADAASAAAAKPISMDGPTLFRERGCSHCHEIKGVGGEKGPDLSGVGRRMKKDAIERQIANGGDAMPAFGQVLPSEEIAALVGYLHKCRDKHTPATKPLAAPAASALGPDGGQ
jgi:ubiquinol-cytochrome c reductase cytochrome b subunit